MIDLLIDRVGNVNIFNFLNSGQFHSESHIQSSIDSDLISEYVKEIENLKKQIDILANSGVQDNDLNKETDKGASSKENDIHTSFENARKFRDYLDGK